MKNSYFFILVMANPSIIGGKRDRMTAHKLMFSRQRQGMHLPPLGDVCRQIENTGKFMRKYVEPQENVRRGDKRAPSDVFCG